MADLYKILIAEKLGHCDSLYESIIGKKLGGYSWISTDYEQTPYIYRAMPNMSHYYNREIMEEVVGGSVGWNQIALAYSRTHSSGVVITSDTDGMPLLNGTASSSDSSATIINVSSTLNHIYCLHCDSKTSYGSTAGAETIIKSVGSYIGFTTAIVNGTTYTNEKRWANITDLTLALGSTIADYVYSLEQSTAGSGVAWLKANFPKMFGQYNPYDSGSIQSVSGLVSHDMVGFNQWDEEWEVGSYNELTGEPVDAPSLLRSKADKPIRVMPNTNYYMFAPVGSFMLFYDESDAFIKYTALSSNSLFITPANAAYARFRLSQSYGTTYNHDICINLSDASKNGTYEPYHRNSYPLDSTVTLRGRFYLDANNKLCADGDIYPPSGEVQRKWTEVDLGSLIWYKNGDQTVYYATLYGCKNQDDIGTVTDAPYIQIPRASSGTDKFFKIISASGNPMIYFRNDAISTASDFALSMSGKHLITELATPTTETAQPFTKTQNCDSGGTEEWMLVGKNLAYLEQGTLNFNTDGSEAPSANRVRTNFIPIETVTMYMASSNGWVIKNGVGYDADKNYIGFGYYPNAEGGEFQNNNERVKYVRFIYGNSTNTNCTPSDYWYQFEKGSTATPYEPYGFNIVSVGHKSKYAEK